MTQFVSLPARRRHLAVGASALVLQLVAGLCLAQAATGSAAALQPCGDVFAAPAGPWDYNDPAMQSQIRLMESDHLLPESEQLERGKSSVNVLDDLVFILRYVPNHYRALDLVARYDIEKGGIPSFSERYLTAECWFDRALQFRPEDGLVWMILGNYRARKEQSEKALEAYERARTLLRDSPEVHYNMGLLYLKLGDDEKALSHARKAYAGQYPLQGLRRKLAEKGYVVTDQVMPP